MANSLFSDEELANISRLNQRDKEYRQQFAAPSGNSIGFMNPGTAGGVSSGQAYGSINRPGMATGNVTVREPLPPTPPGGIYGRGKNQTIGPEGGWEGGVFYPPLAADYKPSPGNWSGPTPTPQNTQRQTPPSAYQGGMPSGVIGGTPMPPSAQQVKISVPGQWPDNQSPAPTPAVDYAKMLQDALAQQQTQQQAAQKAADDARIAAEQGAAQKKQGYINTQTGLYNDYFTNQQNSQLAALKNTRETALSGFNNTERVTQQNAYNNRNQVDSQSVQTAQKLKEILASQGLLASGDSVTQNLQLENQRQSSLNEINQSTSNVLQNVADQRNLINNQSASSEQSLTDKISADKTAALIDLQNKGDQKEMDLNKNAYQEWNDAMNRLVQGRQLQLQDDVATANATGKFRGQDTIDALNANRDYGLKKALADREGQAADFNQWKYKDESAYNRLRDARNDTTTADNTAYNRLRDARNDTVTAGNTAYNRSRDQVADAAKYDGIYNPSGLSLTQINQKMAANSDVWEKATPAERQRLHEENQYLASLKGSTYDPNTGEYSQGNNYVGTRTQESRNTEFNQSVVLNELRFKESSYKNTFDENVRQFDVKTALDEAYKKDQLTLEQYNATTQRMNSNTSASSAANSAANSSRSASNAEARLAWDKDPNNPDNIYKTSQSNKNSNAVNPKVSADNYSFYMSQIDGKNKGQAEAYIQSQSGNLTDQDYKDLLKHVREKL